jgi:hypothetical protein
VDADQVYDLTGWPVAPGLVRLDGGRVRLRAGLTILEVDGVPEGVDLMAQSRLP